MVLYVSEWAPKLQSTANNRIDGLDHVNVSYPKLCSTQYYEAELCACVYLKRLSFKFLVE